MARSLQVSAIAHAVAVELEDTIDRLYPDALDEAAHAGHAPPDEPADGIDVRAPQSGYVQEVNAAHLLRVAESHDVTVWVTARPGTFVVEGMCVARLSCARDDEEKAARAVASAFAIGTDRLSQGYTRLATRAAPDPGRLGGDGRVRVIALPYSFCDLLTLGLEQIARASGSSPLVVERLPTITADLFDVARTDDARSALREVAHVALQALAGSGEALTVAQRRRLDAAGARLRVQ